MAAPDITKDIRDYLLTQSITPVTIGVMNPDPVTQFAVVEYGGILNTKTHGATTGKVTIALDNAMIQVQARSKVKQTAKTNILLAVDALDGLKDTTINTVVYTYVGMVARPRIISLLEEDSVVYAADFQVQCRR